jgi:U1 small nuclear ribonucleoprotein
LEHLGAMKSVRIVRDSVGKSKGYGFVEFEREKDLQRAYKEGAHLRKSGRRLLVDVERGRTVKGWKPRWMGGGIGKKREESRKGDDRRDDRRDGRREDRRDSGRRREDGRRSTSSWGGDRRDSGRRDGDSWGGDRRDSGRRDGDIGRSDRSRW